MWSQYKSVNKSHKEMSIFFCVWKFSIISLKSFWIKGQISFIFLNFSSKSVNINKFFSLINDKIGFSLLFIFFKWILKLIWDVISIINENRLITMDLNPMKQNSLFFSFNNIFLISLLNFIISHFFSSSVCGCELAKFL